MTINNIKSFTVQRMEKANTLAFQNLPIFTLGYHKQKGHPKIGWPFSSNKFVLNYLFTQVQQLDKQ